MKGFRNICFIHSIEDSYDVCYLKQFFKWIGFSYFTFTPDTMGIGLDILRKPENQGFDIIVGLNQVAQWKDSSIISLFGNRLVILAKTDCQQNKDLLDQLIDKIDISILKGCHSRILKELAQIYRDNQMVKVMYEYTTILMESMDDAFFSNVRQLVQKALHQVNSMLDEMRQPDSMVGYDMIEYVLYAKYSCQRKINELYKMKKWVLEYPVPKMLEDLEEIYQYDKGFYRVEFLKAKVAEQSLMRKAYAKLFYHNAINACGVDLCKSYLFYQLGKWLDNNKQIYTAGQAYYRAYECNPVNMKAVFKLVVDARRKKAVDLERKYLRLLIRNWDVSETYKSFLPLMELEYGYKAYMLLDELERTDMQHTRFYSKGKEILEYTKNLHAEAGENHFIKRLYNKDDEEEIKGIGMAIACRMDIKCQELQHTGR